MSLDLNCDLGEGETSGRARALMRWVSSVNVACGDHAGTLRTMRACVELAGRYQVRLGAHPGWPSRKDFGRGRVVVEADELELLLLQQVGALQRIASCAGITLHHVKLHGALYHAVEASPALARRLVTCVRRHFPGVILYARSGGRVVAAGRHSGVTVWEEIFADRAYTDTGLLVPRGEGRALLTDPNEVLARVRLWRKSGRMATCFGGAVALSARSVCVHSDTPGAPALARLLAREFRPRQFAS